ncbi:MAG: SDR family oxidoreductase [Acidimicrobiia bacterium]
MGERVAVLGAGGMLGHEVYARFNEAALSGALESASGVVRRPVDDYEPWLPVEHLHLVTDARDEQQMNDALATLSPTVVVNCVGLLKPLCSDPVAAIEVNSLFPHRLSQWCEANRVRLIHVSTDCVFSGRTGLYDEASIPDPVDVYGRSKLLGEPMTASALTVRTSIIGHEFFTSHNLLDWLVTQHGEVQGYTESLWSGVSTITLADVLLDLIVDHASLTGLLHVPGEAIDKYRLLVVANEVYELGLTVRAVPGEQCDRRLRSIRTDYTASIPSLESQLAALRHSLPRVPGRAG